MAYLCFWMSPSISCNANTVIAKIYLYSHRSQYCWSSSNVPFTYVINLFYRRKQIILVRKVTSKYICNKVYIMGIQNIRLSLL